MRVWHLCGNRWNSAIAEYALSAARALALAGHDGIFTPLAGAPLDARARPLLAVRPVGGFGLAHLLTLRSLAREIKPDVIMTYGGPETVVAKALRRASGARVVRFRGQELSASASGPLALTRIRLAHTHVELVLTPSDALARDVRQAEPRRRVTCVPLGIDTEKYRRVASAGAGDLNRPELVMLGRLDPIKGHERLFQVFARVLAGWPAGRPRPRLHIVGEPANLTAADVGGYARAAGVVLGEDALLTTARVKDLAPLLSAATLGVIPSLGSEIICRVAEEFLVCGTPIAVSGAGSLDETLFDGTAGFTWRGLDDAATAAKLAEWIRRSAAETPEEKATRAARAVQRFSLKTMGKVLSEALDGPRA